MHQHTVSHDWTLATAVALAVIASSQQPIFAQVAFPTAATAAPVQKKSIPSTAANSADETPAKKDGAANTAPSGAKPAAKDGGAAGPSLTGSGTAKAGTDSSAGGAPGKKDGVANATLGGAKPVVKGSGAAGSAPTGGGTAQTGREGTGDKGAGPAPDGARSGDAGKSTADATKDSSGPQAAGEKSPAIGSAENCRQYREAHPALFVMIYDAKAGAFDPAKDYTYPGVSLQVCIESPDFRMRYRVVTTYVDLPSLGDKELLPWAEKRLTAGLKTQGADSGTANAGIPIADQLQAAQEDIAAEVNKLKSSLSRLTGGDYVGSADAKGIEQAAIDSKAALEKQLGYVKSAEAEISASDTEASKQRDLATQLKQRAADYLALSDAIVVHIHDVRKNVFSVRSMKEKHVEVAVSGERLKTDQTDRPTLKYTDATELGRRAFDIRSLSYVRYGLGLVYTDIRNQSFQRAQNDVGAEVLHINTDVGLVPMIFLSHYWCGADERETQPWDKRRGDCWKYNTFIPTFTVGIPLSQNPLKNLYVGLTLQPVPAVGLTAGLHVGEVTRVRSSFVDGSSLPPTSAGFRDQDVTEDVVRAGFYAGLIITDAVFSKLIRNSIQ